MLGFVPCPPTYKSRHFHKGGWGSEKQDFQGNRYAEIHPAPAYGPESGLLFHSNR